VIGQRDLQAVSTDSEPELVKKTRSSPFGAISARPLGEIEGDGMAHLERGREIESHQLALDGRRDLLAAMAGIDAPEPGGAVDHLAAVNAGVIHALGGGDQPRRFLELPVCRERHPEGFEVEGVGNLVNRHGATPFAGVRPSRPTGTPTQQDLFWPA
jgi:hypothetical protein